jgi:hypothetical protein
MRGKPLPGITELELHIGLTTAQGGFGISWVCGLFYARRFQFWRTVMTPSGLLGAGMILAAVMATPATAQVAIQEPGAYAQAYPSANVYNYRHGPTGSWPREAVGEPIAPIPFQGSDDDYYAIYYRDRPVTRITTCGLRPDATYLGPDGRWYPC